ncbi:hypothetical protein, conserved [Plasmodium ovale curtisi]|uniref:NAD(+) kinase n=1 Tax=Plasmodium ovale curtisi TaxID=864141 RepID=A0A1A8WTU3_PLAOA|nr:hypothetical protein, conserved [Plasmodium ovale curtisi]
MHGPRGTNPSGEQTTGSISARKFSLIKRIKMIPHIGEKEVRKREYSFTSDRLIKDTVTNNMGQEKKKNRNDKTSDTQCANCLDKPNEDFTLNNMNEKRYKRILLIEKYTKYDNLRKQGFKDEYILKNFFTVYISHLTHTLIVNNIINILRTKYKTHVSILKAYKRNIEAISISSSSVFSPDAIFSVGGDGTYLESAHIIANKYIVDESTNRRNKRIELVGINSDPKGSEGKLCLDYFPLDSEEEINYAYTSFREYEEMYINKKKKKNFIFIDVCNFIKKLKEKEKRDTTGSEQKGEDIDKNANVIENIVKNNRISYDDKLQRNSVSPMKWDNCIDVNFEKSKGCHNTIKGGEAGKEVSSATTEEDIAEGDKAKKQNIINDLTPCVGSTGRNEISDNVIISVEEYAKNTLRNFFETNKHKKMYRKYITVYIKRSNEEDFKTYKSINEVYIYEAVKNNICTYINIDNRIVKKLKSTALLITSGTGSTAWAYNVNKIDKKKMKNIIDEFLNIQNDVVKKNVKNINFELFSQYINSSICFHPNSKYMKCIVKEPVENSVYDSTDHIYNCKYIDIKTCTSNTIVYIDGIYNIKIQPNDSVIMHIKEDDFIVSYK